MKENIEQLLRSAAATPVNDEGLLSTEETVNEFRRRREAEKNVPYWGYFFKSAAVIAAGFTLLFFFCLTSGKSGTGMSMEQLRQLSACIAMGMNLKEF